MGGLALEGNGLLAIDGHGVPLRDVVDARALLAGPVRARCFERISVERGGAIGDRLDEFDVCVSQEGKQEEGEGGSGLRG